MSNVVLEEKGGLEKILAMLMPGAGLIVQNSQYVKQNQNKHKKNTKTTESSFANN